MTRSAVQIAIAAVVLLAACRTFFVMGVLAPLAVEGSSMAPALRGPHAAAVCPKCSSATRVGIDQLPESGVMVCPHCLAAEINLADAATVAGDRLVLDRRHGLAAEPRRWDVVVLRKPDDAQRLCVKRVIGLPGEGVAIRGGDVFVDGLLERKSLDDQRRVRVLVHEEAEACRRWRAESRGWTPRDDGWRSAPRADGAPARLSYESPTGDRVRDDLPGNQRVTRRLNGVRDLMLTADVRLDAVAECGLSIEQDGQTVSLWLDARAGRVALVTELESGRVERVAPIANTVIGGAAMELTLSLFDRRALAAVGDRTMLLAELPATTAEGRGQRFWLTAEGGAVAVDRLRLWRDLYYEPAPAGFAGRPGPWRLGRDEWFVVGDNQAVSADSRSWPAGAVAGRLLVGRVRNSP